MALLRISNLHVDGVSIKYHFMIIPSEGEERRGQKKTKWDKYMTKTNDFFKINQFLILNLKCFCLSSLPLLLSSSRWRFSNVIE